MRLRLERHELAFLAETGNVEDSVSFSPKTRFVYALRAVPEQEIALRAAFTDGRLEISIRTDALARLSGTEAVGTDAVQDAGDGQVLRILVEKDFACLHARPFEEETDAFENPRRA